MAVKIVTDSTSDLPPEIAGELGITVVPLNIHFGMDVFKDGVDLPAEQFYDRLTTGSEFPKTSQPSVGEFVEAYQSLSDEADGIVSVHASSKLSGTFNSASQARSEADVGCPIEVIDTAQASMGMGLVAMKAAKAANNGGTLDEVTRGARESLDLCQCVALFETIEYLRRGGRLGQAGALVGKLLRIRPMIIIREGVVHELAKERTRAKGIARLQSTARDFAPLEGLAVMYSTTPDDAAAVADSLSDLLPDGREPIVARFGPVLGTYTGPGALGLGILRSRA